MNLKSFRLTKWCRRPPPKHLLRYRIDIGKVGPVSKGREPIIPDDPINLRLSLMLNLRVYHHGQVKRMNRRHSLDGGGAPGFVSVSRECKKRDEMILTDSTPPA